MKKLLSIILAAAMLMSLVPSVFAEGEETAEPAEIVYDITTGSLDLENLYDFSYNKYAISAAANNRSFYDPITYDPEATDNTVTARQNVDGLVGAILYNFDLASWKALSYIKKDASATYGAVAVPEGYPTMLASKPKWAIENFDSLTDRRVTSEMFRITLKTTAGSFGALRIKVEEEGDYDLTIASPKVTEDGGIANVYLVKADDSIEKYSYSDIVKSANYIGKYITDSNTTGHGSFTAKNVIYEPGEYVLAFSHSRTGVNGGFITAVSSITLTPHDADAIEVPFALPQKILHVGETLKLEGVPYGTVLTSSNSDVLTVNAKGEVEGVGIGKATVTAGTGESVEIPVVGTNLISDPYFEKGLYNSSGYGTTATSTSTKWKLSTTATKTDGKVAAISSTLEENITLPGRTATVSGATVESINARIYITNDTFTLDRNKIYEFTGWAKLEKNGEASLPGYSNSNASLQTSFLNDSDVEKTGSASKSLWQEGDYEVTDASVDWNMFSTGSIMQHRTNLSTGDSGATLSTYPRFSLNQQAYADVGFIATVTEFSFHEVVPASIELSANEITLGLGEDDTKTATVSVVDSYSNTGTRITNYNSGAPSVKGTPSFKSNNTAVATVDASTGVITAVGEGEATITAETTIAGVDLSATVKVIVSDGEEDTPAESTVSFAETTNIDGFDNIEIKSVSRGEAVELTAHKKEIEGYKFIGWKRGADTSEKNSWVEISGDTYNVWTNTYLTAIYEKETDAAEKAVEFWNQNGAYIGKMDEATYNAQEALFTPSLVGFGNFLGWFTEKDVPFTAGLTLADGITNAVAQYSASSVSGVKFGGNTIPDADTYDKEIELSATTDATTCWKRDGEIIAYGDSYTFNVWDATDITEGTEEISDKVPVAVLDYSEKYNAYMLEYDAGDYEIVEAGIIFGKDTPDMKRFTSQRKVSHNQFTVPEEEGLDATGYIVYTLDKGASYKFKYVTVPVAE